MSAARESAGGVIVFDGVCNLCSATVRRIIERDRCLAFRFAPLQSETGRRLLEGHDIDPDDARTFLLVKGDRAYVRSEAALRIAAELGGAWRLAAMLLRVVPRRLRDRVYDFVAGRRYRWFGRRRACMVPGPELRDRFLD